MDAKEQVDKSKEFIKKNYMPELDDNLRHDKKVVDIDFAELNKFDFDFANLLLEQPEETLKAFEIGIGEFDKENITGTKARFFNLPESRNIQIQHIRSKDLDKFVQLEGNIFSISTIRPLVTSAKWECPSCGNIINMIMIDDTIREPSKCLPKGTLIHTPQGLKPIEQVKEVLCLDYNGKIIQEKAKLTSSGVLNIYKINDEIECSENHMWYVVRGGKCRYLPTKDLYSSDILLMIDENNLYYLSEGIRTRNKSKEENRQGQIQSSILGEQNMFGRVSKKTINTLPEKTLQGRCRPREDIRHVHQPKNGYEGYSPNIICKQESSINKIKRQQYTSQVIPRTNYDRHKTREKNISYWGSKSILQEWGKMWRRILQKDSAGESNRRMSLLWNKGKVDSSSQRFKSSKSFYRQSDSYVQFMPYEISRIVKTNKKVEMYDLQVLDYNNFIISINHKNILSHNCGCGRKGKFNVLSKELVDHCSIILEECPENSNGSNLAQLHIMLKNDLINKEQSDKLYQGLRVRVTGFLKEIYKFKRDGSKSTKLEWFLEVNHIYTFSEDYTNIKLTGDDIIQIKDFAKQENVIEVFKNKLFCGVYGRDIEKCALLLSAFGGVKKDTKLKYIRGDIHILLTGEPSTAKSTLGEIIARICPKSRYFSCGKKTSDAGLTGACIRDELLGAWSVKAGALSMANKGICVADELNALSQETYTELNEALERQIISIRKAANADLKSECSFIGIANPKHGTFDKSGNLSDQINIPPPTLSRMDLIFTFFLADDEKSHSQIVDVMMDTDIVEDEGLILFFKKYITYAKRNVFPKMTKESIDFIKTKYIEVLDKGTNTDFNNVPITKRDLRAIQRLAEAYAKMKLQNEVTVEEARFAFAIKLYSLQRTAFDEQTGTIDTMRIECGESITEVAVARKLELIFKRNDGEINISDLQKELAVELHKEYVDDDIIIKVLEKMRRSGDVFEPRYTYYKRLQ